VHFVRGRPLWLDEQSVFKSVALNNTTDFFTKPLQAGQVFPRLYLCLIQKTAQFFKLSVWSVRFLPFISMLLAFTVWFRVGRMALKDNTQYLIFVGCWVASIPLIYYSAELKQYSMDVLASGLFTWFLYRQEGLAKELGHQKYNGLLILLPFLGLFSYPAFLFMIFPLYNIVMAQNKSKIHWEQMTIYLTVMILVIAMLYLIDLRVAKTTVDTQGFTDYSLSFESIPEFFRSLGEGTMNLFSRWFTEEPRYFKKVGVFFMVFGMLFIPWAFSREWKRNHRQISCVEMMAVPIYFELLLLGAMKKYPFTVPRTSLFYCPITFLMTIKAISLIKTYNNNAYRLIMGGFVLFLLVVSMGIVKVVMTKNLGSICFIW
jgi:hypothetical protein